MSYSQLPGTTSDYFGGDVESPLIAAMPDAPLSNIVDALAVVYDVGSREGRLVCSTQEHPCTAPQRTIPQ